MESVYNYSNLQYIKNVKEMINMFAVLSKVLIKSWIREWKKSLFCFFLLSSANPWVLYNCTQHTRFLFLNFSALIYSLLFLFSPSFYTYLLHRHGVYYFFLFPLYPMTTQRSFLLGLVLLSTTQDLSWWKRTSLCNREPQASNSIGTIQKGTSHSVICLETRGRWNGKMD